MSIARSPRRNSSLYRREEISDAKRTVAIIGGLLAVVALMFVAAITLMVRP